MLSSHISENVSVTSYRMGKCKNVCCGILLNTPPPTPTPTRPADPNMVVSSITLYYLQKFCPSTYRVSILQCPDCVGCRRILILSETSQFITSS